MADQAEESPPTLKRPKLDWQENLVLLMAGQQEQLRELTRQVNMAARTSDVSTSAQNEAPRTAASYVSFRLSEFDPDNSDHAIEEWLAVADTLKKEENIGDGLMIAKTGEALKGRAHAYYCDWKPIHRTWDEFQKDLVVAFPDRETAGARAFLAATLKSNDYISLSDYGIKKLRAIKKFHSDLPWSTVISMVEYGLRHTEAQAAIRMQQPNSERDLLKLFSEYDARRHIVTQQRIRNSGSSDMKWPDKGVKGPCFRCGQVGHHQATCSLKPNIKQSNKTLLKQKEQKPAETEAPTCTHCGRMGHTEPNCWSKHGKLKRAFVFRK